MNRRRMEQLSEACNQISLKYKRYLFTRQGRNIALYENGIRINIRRKRLEKVEKMEEVANSTRHALTSLPREEEEEEVPVVAPLPSPR